MESLSSSKPSRYGFASPFPWSDSSRGRNFMKMEGFEGSVPKQRLPLKNIGPGSGGNSVFATEISPEALTEALSPTAATIAKQMGGLNRLAAMLGLNWRKGYFAYDLARRGFGISGFEKKHGLALSFPNRKRSRGNAVLIRYDKGPDAYSMAFLNVAGDKVKVVKKYNGIYADQLASTFEKQTGLHLRI